MPENVFTQLTELARWGRGVINDGGLVSGWQLDCGRDIAGNLTMYTDGQVHGGKRDSWEENLGFLSVALSSDGSGARVG